MDKNLRREVILKQITKIQTRLVVHRNAIIIDQSARLRLTIVRMTAMMIVRNGRNIRNTRGDRRRVNVAIHRTRNQVDRVSTPTMVTRIEIVHIHETEAAEVRHIQALSTNQDHVRNRETGDRIIVISLSIIKERKRMKQEEEEECKYKLVLNEKREMNRLKINKMKIIDSNSVF